LRPKAHQESYVSIEMEEETVTISVSRLKELEQASALLATVQEKLNKRMNNNVERLRHYDVTNPDKRMERTKRSQTKNREAQNERRRELYRLKKEIRDATAVA